MKIPAAAVAALLALAALPAAPPPPAEAQAPTTIKLATLVPDGSVWDRILRDMGASWSKSTQGRVTLRVYPGGVVGDEPDIVRKMRIGQIQAAALTTSGLSAIDPAFKMFGIPMFFESYAELVSVLNAMEPTIQKRLEAKGFVLLLWGHGGWVHVFTRQPAATLAELRKARMFAWAGDEAMVQLWKHNGFQPVALAATDIMTGLQTGMIDALPTTPLAALSLQWFRSTPYMVGMGIAPLVGGMVITKQAWNRLSPADRTAMLQACARAEKRLEVEVPRQDTTAVAEMKKRGVKVVEIAPNDVSQWKATAESFAAKLREGQVPPEILDEARRERDAYRRSRKGR